MDNNNNINRVIDIGKIEARRDFFLKEESYFNAKLPEYFDVNKILELAVTKLGENRLSNYYHNDRENRPWKMENVNHTILINKDKHYEWRPLSLIHPILYVDLVNYITDEEIWDILKNRLTELRKQSKVECTSIPIVSQTKKSDVAESILNWWNNLEQAQIHHSLTYKYCGHTDIANCYASMYTHSIAWAIHGKLEAKSKKNDTNMIGNVIDSKISTMQYGQTNGIPQGSVLMDFIAEIILAYADSLFTDKLGEKFDNYKIIRYRDDYRIFSNSREDIDGMIKILSETLSELNLKLNSNKTFITDNIIKDAVKKDKVYWTTQYASFMKKQNKGIEFKISIQKHLFQIKLLSDKYPQSGSIRRALTDIYKERIYKLVTAPRDINQLISIIIDIMINNPNAIEHCVAILSKLLSLIEKKKAKDIVKNIISLFNNIINTDYMKIWLQRLSIPYDKGIKYDVVLCDIISEETKPKVWESSWLRSDFEEIELIDTEKIKNIKKYIEPIEIDLFGYK